MQVCYRIRTLPCGTEFDQVTVKRKTYLAIESSVGHFPSGQIDLIHQALKASQIDYKYVEEGRFFALHTKDMFLAQSALEKYKFSTKDQVPYFVWRWLCDVEEQPRVSEDEIQQRLGEDIWNKLHPYQRVCVQKAVEAKHFYIADEMGTGKTFQCLATCKYFQSQWPVLVFCPSSLRYTWKSEILRWLTTLQESEILVAKSGKQYLKCHSKPHNFLIVSYSLLTNKSIVSTLIQHRYQVVVFDEAHYVKSMFSKRATQACNVAEHSEIKLLLSGTPFNYPSEMFQQIKIINPTLYPRFFNYRLDEDKDGVYYFAKRYCKPKSYMVKNHNVWSFNGYENHEELNALLSTIMVRRRKIDILTQLPEKNRICITLDPLAPKQIKEIEELMKKEEKKDDKKEKEESKYMEAFRLTNKYKISNVIKFIKEQILDDYMTNNPDAKVLIFFHHEAMQKALEELIGDKVPYFVISGATNALKREEFKEDFQNTNKYKIGLLSITAAGVGLTLTAASTEIFTEILFGPNDHLQAEDRAHRLGQKSTVNIFYLLQPKTTDDINFGLIRKKERESSLMLDGSASSLPARRVDVSELVKPATISDIMKHYTSREETLIKRPLSQDAEQKDPSSEKSRPATIIKRPRPMIQVYKLQDS